LGLALDYNKNPTLLTAEDAEDAEGNGEFAADERG
jgi:hypothetical protein